MFGSIGGDVGGNKNRRSGHLFLVEEDESVKQLGGGQQFCG